MKVNRIIPVLLLTVLFFACSNHPSYVLSEKKLEKVLYDVYIAEAEINANPSMLYSDSTRKRDLLNSVFKKHKITEAVLDTSLSWYSGHLDRYLKINENVGKRLTGSIEELRRREEMTKKPGGIRVADNALILPVKEKSFLISLSNSLRNVHPFAADTVLSLYNGTYELQFNVLGIPASQHPVLTLCVQCVDTLFVKRDTITQNGLFASSINIQQGKQSKKIYGSIYFPEVNPGTNVFVSDFTLTHSQRTLPAQQAK